MYAVIKAGGHQYRVNQGDELTIDFQKGNEGDKLTFDNVLMLGDKDLIIGDPIVQGASVEAIIKRQKRDPKIIVFKFKRRKNSKKTQGHKQPVTVIEVTKITK